MRIMDFLKGFIGTLGLDKTFFFQISLVVVLYFILNKLLFRPYLKLLEKRESLTKGKFSEGKQLEVQMESLKQEYEKRSRKLYSEFQKLFSKIKQESEKEFQIKREALKKAHSDLLRAKKEEILKSEKESEEDIKKAIPSFVEALVNKMKGSA